MDLYIHSPILKHRDNFTFYLLNHRVFLVRLSGSWSLCYGPLPTPEQKERAAMAQQVDGRWYESVHCLQLEGRCIRSNTESGHFCYVRFLSTWKQLFYSVFLSLSAPKTGSHLNSFTGQRKRIINHTEVQEMVEQKIKEISLYSTANECKTPENM
jgi:hypothetical protein